MSRQKQAEYKKRSQLSIIWNRLRKNKLAMLGLAILVVMVALAVCADWIADYDTNVTGMNMAERLQTLPQSTGSARTAMAAMCSPASSTAAV